MSNLSKKFNLKSPAVKRLMREAAELSEPTEQYFAQPLEDNLFEWHFTVRGPPDSEFAGGRYHGRITLPAEYPMKPPSIILLTPNGRFELGKKICLSMSAHHPETWQPSWSIRTVLLALIGFMPTKGGGAIGALDYTAEERKTLAEKSMNWICEVCGIDHKACLLEADPEHESKEIQEAKELAAQIDFKGESAKSKSSGTPNPDTEHQTSSQNQMQDINQQQAYEYMSQYYSMYNQPGGGLSPGGPFVPSQQPVPPANTSSLGTSSRIEQNTSRSSSHTNSDTVRQRTNAPPRCESAQESSNSQSPPSIPASTPSQTQNQHSMTDYITLTLMWIITAILVLLILRRLVMEGTNMTKS